MRAWLNQPVITVHCGRWVFIPTRIAMLALLLLLPILIWLGCWQWQRALLKTHWQQQWVQAAQAPPLPLARIQPPYAQWRYRQVILTGEYDNQHQWLLDNQFHQHQLGYQVLTPFHTQDQQTVIINRGWIARGNTRAQLPRLPPLSGTQTVIAQVALPPSKTFVLQKDHFNSTDSWPRVIQVLEINALQAQLSASLKPYLLLLSPQAAHGFVRNWTITTFSAQKHVGYAWQWFSLAAALVIIFIVVNTRKARHATR